MRIGTNTAAMNTNSRLSAANTAKANSLAKLSSGLRINKAGDDAAGLSISEKMKNQVSGLTQASRNAQDGISLIQTAEGALGETHSILNRMRDLTVQAANDTNSADDRTAIKTEMDALGTEIGKIASNTQFNGTKLLDGSATTTPLNFQVGANADETQQLTIADMKATTLGVDDLDVDTSANANLSLATIDTAIKSVSKERANLGATQNRLDHTVSNLSTTKVNLSEANSRITDVDMAEEMTSFTKSNILAQAATSMLAQANQMPQSVLSLLQ
ncbi:flagellin [Trichococcus palustris]|uniref:Flagellin n=1 Tax=Trichococcus palustris TaxID=140314 RepID=A0A143Z1D7_9LACT|nr:flagellin [Trichococcus palustris]CZR02663.1 flagellin [Trichococcus palustris]SFL13732.1 flagellin [Trichococcus palustris]